MILDIIQGGKEYPELLKGLTQIKADVLADQNPEPNSWFTGFSSLGEASYKYIYDALRTRGLIRDNEIWLNDLSKDFGDTLDHKKLSFLHAFLIFVLLEYGKKIKLEYKGGPLVYNAGIYELNKEPIPTDSSVIIRHGTDRDNSIPRSFFSEVGDVQLKTIKGRQTKFYNHGLVEPRWSNAALTAVFNPETTRRYEYLNAATSVLCSNYVSSIASLLKPYNHQKKHFRVALYRTVYTQGDYYFQQITSYFGSKQTDGNKSIGQVFPIDRGNVGASFKSGHPTLIVNRKEEDFMELVKNMGVTGDADLDKIKKNKSFLSFPILAHIDKASKKMCVNLVLSVDSTDETFFVQQAGQEDIIRLICSATSGFIESVNHHINFHELSMVDIDFEPPLISNSLPEFLSNNDCFEDICRKFPDFTPSQSRFAFDQFFSFTVR